jgi:DNA-binding transcriptional LysR family regulator
MDLTRLDLNGALTFVRVVQAGSFSAAARNLKMPVSTVSTKIARLEQDLQISLLRRTTRKLHLTEAGERFFAHAVRAVSELQEAQASLSATHADPQGTLKITATVDMGTTILSDIVAEFLKLYPLIRIELILTDRVVDLIGEGIDLGIRAGHLEDSSLVSRKIGATHFEAYASPSYVKKRGTPKKPQDLEKQDCLTFAISDYPSIWQLHGAGGKIVKVQVQSRFSVNNLASLHRLVLRGHGIGLLPSFLCAADVESGKLVPLLDGWTAERVPVSIVYPKQSFVPLALRTFIDYLTEHTHEVF